VLAFRVYFARNYSGVQVSGSSMCQTLYDGEQLLMKNTDGSDAKRGDVIVVYVGDYDEFMGTSTQYLIKRLIAVEGDVVCCKDGQIYICYAGTYDETTPVEQLDFYPLDEPYAYYRSEESKMNYDFQNQIYVVGEAEIFFLGDNRNNSMDSRYKEMNGSHLKGLYRATDVYGVVPEWAMEHQEILEKIFFRSEKENK
jgi:signal peptidase I